MSVTHIRKDQLPRNVYKDRSHAARHKPYFVQVMRGGEVYRKGMFLTVEEADVAAEKLRNELKVFSKTTMADLNDNVKHLIGLIEEVLARGKPAEPVEQVLRPVRSRGARPEWLR